DRTAVGRHDLAGDVEAQAHAGSSWTVSLGYRKAVKSVEQVRHELGSNAWPIILDLDHGLAILAGQPNVDGFRPRSVGQRVAHEVEERLAEPTRIRTNLEPLNDLSP